MLKPQDLLVALKATLLPAGGRFRFSAVAADLGLSRSEVHAAVSRAVHAKLLMRVPLANVDGAAPIRRNILEFVLHGARYAFPPDLGGVTRGLPTGYAAPVLSAFFAPASSLPPVWPDPNGSVRGRAFEPLYRSAPGAAAKDERLYALLALTDAIRGGGAREREIAARLLTESLATGETGAER